MHRAKIGILAVALAGAIAIVLGVFQRDEDDTGHVTDDGVSATSGAAGEARAGAGSPVGQGWAAFAAAGVAPPVDDRAATPGAVGSLRRGDGAKRRGVAGRAGDDVVSAADARVRDPGADSWRLDGAKREGAVAGEGYREAATGERTELTSGRHIGDVRVRVPPSTELDVALAGRDGVPVRAEVCVGKSGKPTEVRVVEGTGVARVDERVARELLAGRYRPLRREGRRVEFCERATVIVTGT